MELLCAGLICSITLGMGIWAVNRLSPGLETSEKMDNSMRNKPDKRDE